MAMGKRRPSEIVNYIGVESRKIYLYLENLMRLGFVERELPVGRKAERASTR
ncbi:helix-turn-helix domain-containing protein [Pyrococcus kukulkanii]|uniref:helix-turn-helix domain-containing protein n=1 Tax=Pyrococcus kukulkanii TaxID=1609559 RepID=UPI00356B404F